MLLTNICLFASNQVYKHADIIFEKKKKKKNEKTHKRTFNGKKEKNQLKTKKIKQ